MFQTIYNKLIRRYFFLKHLTKECFNQISSLDSVSLKGKQHPKVKCLFFLLFLCINSCATESMIKDLSLRDRVYACSLGFSDDIRLSLNNVYNTIKTQGGITLELKNNFQAVIFSKMSKQDALKAYEDYINCIEKNWNKESQRFST